MKESEVNREDRFSGVLITVIGVLVDISARKSNFK